VVRQERGRVVDWRVYWIKCSWDRLGVNVGPVGVRDLFCGGQWLLA
jgi:hypothetical protein